MQFTVDTDNHLEGRQALAEHVERAVREAVGHHEAVLTHVEAHLGDDTGSARKTGGAPEHRCLLEARVAGLKNLAVTHHAPTLQQAIDGAARKLRHALDAAVGKRGDAARSGAGPGQAGIEPARDEAGRG